MSEPRTTDLTEEGKFFGMQSQDILDKEPEEPSLVVEVVDDRPADDQRAPRAKTSEEEHEEEIEEYGAKVGKRIKKLKYDFHEERREKESAQRLEREAVTVTQHLYRENQQLKAIVGSGEKAIVGQMKASATNELETARELYKQAQESDNADDILAANERLNQAQINLTVANQREQNLASRPQQPPQAPAAQPARPSPQPQQPPTPDPKAVEWTKENPWFQSPEHMDMTSLVMGLHEQMTQYENVDPQSDEYYERIDKTMRQRFPEYFEEEEGEPETVTVGESGDSPAAPPRRSPVAPAGRNHASKPRTVQLSSSQVTLAGRLGLTKEQYAAQLIKENYRG